jgi:nucleoside diphosphate kinase
MNTDFEQTIIDYMTGGDCLIARFSGENVVEKLKAIKGKTYHSGLRRDYADNFIHNSFHCPDDDDCCAEELNVLSKNE